MDLHPDAEAALSRWLATPTWSTRQPRDLHRWHAFVNVYQLHHGFALDTDALAGHIAGKAIPMHDALRDVIRERVTLARSILEYLHHVEPVAQDEDE